MTNATTREQTGMETVSTEQLRQWIRTRESMIGQAAEGSWQRRESQKALDYFCLELGRRGEN